MLPEGSVYHETAHDEFLPQSECLDILRTAPSWETEGSLHEGGIQQSGLMKRFIRPWRWVEVEGCGRQRLSLEDAGFVSFATLCLMSTARHRRCSVIFAV